MLPVLNLTKLPPLTHSVQLHHPTLSNLPKRKLFHWLPDGTLQLRLDWSSLETFLGCNRSALYRLVHARSSPPGSALIFGAAMHAALEVWYKERTTSPPAELLPRCYAAIQLAYAEHPIVPINDYRTADYCYESFCKYVTEYSSETLTPISRDGTPLIEFSFSYPIGKTELPIDCFKEWGFGTLTNDAEKEQNPDFYSFTSIPVSIEWTGISDMLCSFNGNNYILDHKTTSLLSQDFFDGFAIAHQPVGYVAACRAAFPELDIKGFIVNVIACRKPTAAVTPSGKKSTAKSFEPHRAIYNYDDWVITEWKADTLALVSEFMHNLTTHFFPKKTQWCVGKYGKCRYFGTCSLTPQYREADLASDNYVDNTWKPV
jgi:hypothetical protein